MSIVIGTAGHIDHGKTSLVQALTGINCDKLSEEKRRGITIDLGFAYYISHTGEKLSIIDVPGHEKFIRNMVAGASGIDVVMLVIAADEGIMPQTKEHIEICSLLGVKHGFIVLTKIDIVDKQWLEVIKEDIKLSLKDTFLHNAPILKVSSTTGEGINNLKVHLNHYLSTSLSKQKTDIFRLPIDRVFTIKGHGTIITGTITSGSISTGEPITILPSNNKTKVKQIQYHGNIVETASAGQRAAINLHGINTSEVKRGDIIAHPDTLVLSTRWLISLTCLSSSPRPLKHRSEVHLHHGTQEVLAQLYFFNKNSLAPGETVLCEVRFKKPLIGIFGDHTVIRTFSPLQTVAGGSIINPIDSTILRHTITDSNITTLLSLPSVTEEELVQKQIEFLDTTGIYLTTLSIVTNIEHNRLLSILTSFIDKGIVICFDKENYGYMSVNTMKILVEQCLTAITNFHKKNPIKQGLEQGIFFTNYKIWGKILPHKLISFIINQLIQKGNLISEGNYIYLPSHTISLSSEQQYLYDNILKLYIEAGYTPPKLSNILTTLNSTIKQVTPIINLLLERKILTHITEDMYYSTQAIKKLKFILQNWFNSHKELDLATFKELSGGLPRKYSIPLLEYFDKERLTIRIGDKRQLRNP